MRTPFQEHFPNFARMLDTSEYACFNEIGDPATTEEIAQLEFSLGAPLPDSFKRFLSCARTVSFGDAFKLDSNAVFFHEFGPWEDVTPKRRLHIRSWPPPSEGMLCFADYWLEGDGDQALFDVSGGLAGGEYPVMYYNHDTPSVRKVADSFVEFIEHVVAKP